MLDAEAGSRDLGPEEMQALSLYARFLALPEREAYWRERLASEFPRHESAAQVRRSSIMRAPMSNLERIEALERDWELSPTPATAQLALALSYEFADPALTGKWLGRHAQGSLLRDFEHDVETARRLAAVPELRGLAEAWIHDRLDDASDWRGSERDLDESRRNFEAARRAGRGPLAPCPRPPALCRWRLVRGARGRGTGRGGRLGSRNVLRGGPDPRRPRRVESRRPTAGVCPRGSRGADHVAAPRSRCGARGLNRPNSNSNKRVRRFATACGVRSCARRSTGARPWGPQPERAPRCAGLSARICRCLSTRCCRARCRRRLAISWRRMRIVSGRPGGRCCSSRGNPRPPTRRTSRSKMSNTASCPRSVVSELPNTSCWTPPASSDIEATTWPPRSAPRFALAGDSPLDREPEAPR